MMQFSPACERNKAPILGVLRNVLPTSGTVLEIGSGTGQHAAWFASALPGVTWQPTDRPGSLASIEAWRAEVQAPNLSPPRSFDLFRDPWPLSGVDAVVAINVIHIVSWQGVEQLVRGAGEALASGGLLFLYGPFRFADQPLAPSNAQFDDALRARGVGSGLRLFEDVDRLAATCGLVFEGAEAMPANNHSLWWRREQTG